VIKDNNSICCRLIGRDGHESYISALKEMVTAQKEKEFGFAQKIGWLARRRSHCRQCSFSTKGIISSTKCITSKIIFSRPQVWPAGYYFYFVLVEPLFCGTWEPVRQAYTLLEWSHCIQGVPELTSADGTPCTLGNHCHVLGNHSCTSFLI
jgi:hypothetical protein